MDVKKTSAPVQIKIKIINPSQETPVSPRAPNEDLKDVEVLCTFEIKIESQNLDYGYIKDQWTYPIKIKMPIPSQEPQASSKATNEDLKDMDILCTFKTKKESKDF